MAHGGAGPQDEQPPVLCPGCRGSVNSASLRPPIVASSGRVAGDVRLVHVVSCWAKAKLRTKLIAKTEPSCVLNRPSVSIRDLAQHIDELSIPQTPNLVTAKL